jgi:hypothetical protein
VLDGAEVLQPTGNLSPAVRVESNGALQLLRGTITAYGTTVEVQPGGAASMAGGRINSWNTDSVGFSVQAGGTLHVRGTGTMIQALGSGSMGIHSHGRVTLSDAPVV